MGLLQGRTLPAEGTCAAWWGARALHPLSRPTKLCRLRAELEVLRSPGTPAAAASLGYSAADLEAEVASLARRRAAHLARATAAAEAAAAAAAGADVVEEQALQRQAAISQRLQAKQQVGAGAFFLACLARRPLDAQACSCGSAHPR